jgi:N-acetylneuraminic acid mutarotase
MLASIIILAVGSILSGTPPRFSSSEAALKVSQGSVTFPERVAYQRAIEDVYWRHRIWPKENANPKPSLDAVMSQAQLENKAAAYLRNSLALEDYGQPITAQQLQAEMDRMARDTKQPDVLQDLFEALGNDPGVIAECLVRPVLAERLVGDLSMHGQTPRFDAQRANGLRTMSAIKALGQVGYTIPKIADEPSTCVDAWTPTGTAGAPDARSGHTAVWTGSEMIVWGGLNGVTVNTGGRYNPATDSWTATSTTNAPDARSGHTAIWTGSEMIVWGGDAVFNVLNTGGRYNPSTDSWVATSTTNVPDARYVHTAVWTGSEMIVWGGVAFGPIFNTGGRYDPYTDSWTPTSTINVPEARGGHTAVWTGSEMIVWGGDDYPNFFNTGGKYNPTTDTWVATTVTNAPSGAYDPTGVWTGNEMIVWGGVNDEGWSMNTGGKYNPSTDRWTLTSSTNAPTARFAHTAVWTASEMIVWGGDYYDGAMSYYLNTGGRYNPSTDSWIATSTSNAPSARASHTAVWTGSEMIILGGGGQGGGLNTGAKYCAVPPRPTPTPRPRATPRLRPTPGPRP